jgi:serine/threonine protein kinase
MICPSCHSENDDARETCGSCGQTLVGSAVPTLTVGAVLASRYEILAELGKGGMGMVFKAKDRVLDEIVALKILRPDVAGSGEMARRFRNEIKLARKVRHKNVCGIHEYSEAGSLRYIAMEYVEGIDLKRLLRERGGLPAPEAFDVALQLAQGLDAIHDVGIIHRDLKTANAMIDSHGVVRLMDFGIAKKFDAEGSLGVTAVGHVIGTPEYMSPEQARGERIDFRADVYGLGVMIFELFTGRVPFRAETPIATIFKHLQEPPPLEGPEAAGIPPALVPVLASCLAKDPEARYPSASALVEALRAAQLATCPEAGAPMRVSRALPGVPGLTRSGTQRPPALPRSADVAPTVSTSTPLPRAGARTGPLTGAPAPPPPPTRLVAATPTLSRESESPPRGRAMLFLVLGAVGLVAVAAIATLLGVWLWPAPRPVPPTDVSGATQGAVSAPVTPAPEATVATVAQVAARPTPAAMSSPRATAPTAAPVASATVTTLRPTLRLDPAAGTPPFLAASPRPTAGLTPTATPPQGSEDVALLDVTAKPTAEVSVDGEPRGQTPLRGLRLKPGAHAIVLSSPDYQPFRRKLTLNPGQRRSLDVDLSWEGVRK